MGRRKDDIERVFDKAELSECELAIMRCIWDMGEPVTAGEIKQKLLESFGLNYKDTTIYTFLKKLSDKGFIQSYRRGVIFFSACRDFEEYRSALMGQSLTFWYGEDKLSVLEGIVKDAGIAKNITDSEKDAMCELIRNL